MSRFITMTPVACALLLCAVGVAQAQDAKKTDDPRAIMDKALQNMRLPGAEMISTLNIYNKKGQQRVRKMATVSKRFDGGTEKRLARFVAPADVKGTGLLTFDHDAKDDDMWLFLPAMRKTRRIVSSERAKSFMGSEFTYADMTPPPLDDFTYALQKTVPIDGVPCWVIEMKPKTEDIADDNGFSKRVVWIGQKDHVMRQVHYFDLDGELHRVMSSKDVKEIDPANKLWRPMHMIIENKQNGRRSELVIEKLQLRADIPDDYFTTRYLERQ
jgi:outer membrane lipoprotein-sorting protein